jgi:hypothetical protein
VKEERRFLKQDEERFWIEVLDTNELVKACHRDLTTAFDPLLRNLITQIDSLQSETKFGKFRETAMQKKAMPDYLRSWDNRLLEKNSKNDATTESFSAKPKQSPKIISLRKSIYSPTRVVFMTTMRDSSLPFRTPTLPQQPLRTEPYDGAWLQEGDRVEGMFRCNEEGKQLCEREQYAPQQFLDISLPRPHLTIFSPILYTR